MQLSEPIENWRRRGAFITVRGMELFHLVQGTGPAVLLLHGFPTSSYDFEACLAGLSKNHRVVAIDMPGYGLSSKPSLYSYSLLDQSDVLLEVCNQLGITEAHIVAHDVGTSVACEMLARREEGLLPLTVRSVTFVNGSVHLEMAKLTPSQRALRRPLLGRVFVRLASRGTFKLQFRRLFGRADAVPDIELDRLWELMRCADGHLRLPQLIRYIDERLQRASRWLPPLTRLDVPTMVLWGERDPVAVIAIARRLANEIPGAKLVTFEDLGHYPQLEDPKRFTDAVTSFVDGVDDKLGR